MKAPPLSSMRHNAFAADPDVYIGRLESVLPSIDNEADCPSTATVGKLSPLGESWPPHAATMGGVYYETTHLVKSVHSTIPCEADQEVDPIRLLALGRLVDPRLSLNRSSTRSSRSIVGRPGG